MRSLRAAEPQVTLEYTLDSQDVASARLLAIGVRPRVEFSLFAVVLIGLLALTASPWSFGSLPVLIGLTAALGAYRLTQIHKVRQEAFAAFQRNPTLRQATVAAWDDEGITIQPLSATIERIPWGVLTPLKENERIVLIKQKSGPIHAIPKRAFADKAALQAFRREAQAQIGRARAT
jgi:YcxB-like protein